MSLMYARHGVLGLISLATVSLDQASKAHIMQTMRLHESISVIPSFFSLTYIRNPGAAFGFLASSSTDFRLLFFAVASLVAAVVLGTIFWRLPQNDWLGQISIAGILGGAIGNLLDRLRLGEVVDFLDFYVNGYHWPAFNVADAAITVGVFVLALRLVMEKKHGEQVLQQDGS